MVLNVSSLLKTVKAVEDEHTRGTRAMEATVEAISQEIRVIECFFQISFSKPKTNTPLSFSPRSVLLSKIPKSLTH